MSLYDELGGAPAVEAVVELFYRKVLADDRISGFFAHTDMDAMRAKQRAFFTMILGGPSEYSGKDMRKAHVHLMLQDVHMDAVLEHLESSLRESGVPEDKVKAIVGAAEGMRNDILNRR